MIVRLLNDYASYAALFEASVHLSLVCSTIVLGDKLHIEAVEVGVCLHNIKYLRVYRSRNEHRVGLLC